MFGVIHVEMNAYLSCVWKIFFKKLKIYLLKKVLGLSLFDVTFLV